MKKKKQLLIYSFTVIFLLVGLLNISTALASENKIDKTSVSVINENELINAITNAPQDNTETEIVIADDFTISKLIKITDQQNIKLVDNGSAHTISIIQTMNAFEIEVGGTFTISTSSNDNSLLVFNGTNADSAGNNNFISNYGTLNWLGGTVQDYKSYLIRTGTIKNEGPNAKMYLKEGLFTNNKGGYFSGVINVMSGASFVMDGGTITNNIFDFMKNASAVYISSYYEDDTIKTPTTFVMNGGTISNNTSTSGGGLFVGSNLYDINFENGMIAKATINDGLITGNKSSATSYNNVAGGGYGTGGGIFVSLAGSVEFNGGTIADNIADIMGGGVATYDFWVDHFDKMYANAGYSTEEIEGIWKNWPNSYPAEFIMNGGVIKNNDVPTTESIGGLDSFGSGGGIYIASNKVTLNAGEIHDNKAADQGGGIYVSHEPYLTHMSNVLVTNNKADIVGGGIWMCPTGNTETYLSSGIAFFDNTAEGAGNDLVSIKKKLDWSLTVAQRMLGGGYENWYNDGAIIDSDTDSFGEPDPSAPRFPNTDPYTNPIINNNTYLALAANPTDNAKTAAQGSAKLLIYNNEAKYGGGIGSNGSITIGPKIPHSDEEINVKVEKVWEDDNNSANKRPESIEVKLKRDGYIIQEVELNTSNDWKYTFENLPKYQDSNEEELSIYEIEEISVPDYTTTYDKKVDENGNITLIIKNTFKEEPDKPKPGKPNKPGKPTKPTEPTEPGIPTEPGEPTEPAEPTEPTEPTEPGKPTEPVKPFPETGTNVLFIGVLFTTIGLISIVALKHREN